MRIENARGWLFALLLCSTCSAQTITIADRGVRNVDNIATDQRGKQFTIAGLSGITWLGGDDFLAVMDNSNKLVRFSITFNEDASINTIKCGGGISLADSRDFATAFMSELKPGPKPSVQIRAGSLGG